MEGDRACQFQSITTVDLARSAHYSRQYAPLPNAQSRDVFVLCACLFLPGYAPSEGLLDERLLSRCRLPDCCSDHKLRGNVNAQQNTVPSLRNRSLADDLLTASRMSSSVLRSNDHDPLRRGAAEVQIQLLVLPLLRLVLVHGRVHHGAAACRALHVELDLHDRFTADYIRGVEITGVRVRFGVRVRVRLRLGSE